MKATGTATLDPDGNRVIVQVDKTSAEIEACFDPNYTGSLVLLFPHFNDSDAPYYTYEYGYNALSGNESYSSSDGVYVAGDASSGMSFFKDNGAYYMRYVNQIL